METVKVNNRGADRIRHGHLWIYQSDVLEARAAALTKNRKSALEC
jgi:hypothetical protein